MSSSTLSSWDVSQSPRKPPSTPPVPKSSPPHSTATAAKIRTIHLADATRRSSLTLRNTSPRSSPRLVHRSSDADEQNVQRTLLESDGLSSPARTTTKSQGYGSGGPRYDTQAIANVGPSKRQDWEAIKKAREGLEKTIEYTEKLTEREYFTSNPLLLLLYKDGKTPATAISLSSSAASVETDGDQNGSELDDGPDPVVCSPSGRDPSVIPETPQREAGSLPPSPTPPFIVRESGSPEIEFYEDPGPSRYSDGPEIEVAAGPERGTSAEESTLIDNNAQSPAKSNVTQSPLTPRTARIPPPEILSSPLTEQSSSEISTSHSPNHSTIDKPRERERTDNAFRPNRAYVDLSPLTDSERTKYAPLAKVPFPRRQQLSRTKLRTTDLPSISIPTREQRPPLARHTISLKASSPEAGPSTAVLPTYISNPLSNVLVVHEKRKRSWEPISPSRRPLSKKKRLRIDTDSIASSSEGTAAPLTSALMPLELGHSPELAVQDRPERANRSTSSRDRELSRPRASQVQKANTQAPGQRTVNNRRKDPLFLMGWGDAGNDPLGSIEKAKPKRTSSGNSTGGRGKGKTSTSRKNSGAGDDDFNSSRGGKGKERASDVGIRSRPLCITIPASAPSAGEHPDGKRVRKPTAQVLETQASGLLPLPNSFFGRSETQPPRRARKSPQGDDSSDEDSSDDQARPLDAMHPVMELTGCHQCRNANAYDKMRCVAIRLNGARCGLRYCERCIVNRYENEVEFNPIATKFECPRCRGVCNCTVCARRRGETYVPTRKAKRIEPNAYFYSIWQQLQAKKNKKTSTKTRRKRHASDDEEEDGPLRQRQRRRSPSSEESDDSSADYTPQTQTSRMQTLSRKCSQSQSEPTETPVLKPKRKTKKQLEEEAKEREILASMALPEGAVWGTVYGLDGTSRIGVGVVADETQRIVLKEGEASTQNAGFPPSTSMNRHGESDDGTVDMEGMESGLHAPWSFSGLSFGDAPSQTPTSVFQTLDTISSAIQSPSTPPRRAP